MAKTAPRSPTSVTIPDSKAKAVEPRRRQSRRTKKDIALSLLRRSKGASIAEMQSSMGWQPHSVRGFLAGTVRKMHGVTLVSEKPERGPRRYRIEAAAE